MTPSQIINRVKNIKPSLIEDSALLSFINTVEAKIRLIINNETDFIPFEFDNIENDALFLDDKHSEVYLFYLASQIDLFSNDIASYNNYITLYNQALSDYSNYVISRKTASISTKYDYEGAFK